MGLAIAEVILTIEDRFAIRIKENWFTECRDVKGFIMVIKTKYQNSKDIKFKNDDLLQVFKDVCGKSVKLETKLSDL